MSYDQPDDIVQAWRESAPYWEKHGHLIRAMFHPITEAMIEEAAVREGDSVLDVAGGIGEPSLTIASLVGPLGRVTATDIAAEMVDAAEREARRRGLTNIAFLQCAADALPFESDSFHVTVSRLGAMFFFDPPTGISEMLRVTRSGGAVSLVVWSRRELNPFFSVVAEVVSRYIEVPREDPDAPGAFRFAQPGKLARILEQVGAAGVRERALEFRIEAPLSFEEFWPMRVEMSDTLRGKLRGLPEDQLRQIEQDVRELTREYFSDGRMSFPAAAIIVTALKPEAKPRMDTEEHR